MRNRIFLRYIASYALVLILPILALYFFFDSAIIRRYSEEIALTNSNMLTQLRDTMDNRFQQLFNLSYVIQNTASLNPRNIGENVMARRDAIALLGTYNSITELPETILVYRSGDAVCYTGTTAITPEKLFGQQLKYAGHTVEDFYQTVDSRGGIIVWPVDSVSQFGGQTMDCVTVFIAVGAGTVHPRQRTVFVIPVSRITDPIRTLLGSDTSVVITDAEGQAILSVGNPEVTGKSREENGQGRIAVGGRTYSVSETASRIMGWKFSVCRPMDTLDAATRGYRQRVTLLMAVILLAGGAVTWAVSWRHYKPIRNLAEKARSYAPGTERGNEMEQVASVLESLSDESRAYRVMLANSTEGLTQNALTRLLSDPAHASDYLEELRGYDVLTEPEALCRVVAMEKKEVLGRLSSSALLERFLAGSLEVTGALICETPPDHDMLALVLQYGGNTEGSREEIQDFRNQLEAEIGQAVSLGVSRLVRAEELADAWQQAESACRMCLIRGRGSAVFYSGEENAFVSLRDYPTRELEALQWHLLQRDAGKVEECLDAIAQKLQREPVSLELARMVLNDTVNVTVRTLLSMGDPVNPEVSFGTLEQLLSFDSVQELMERLKDMTEKACSRSQEEDREKENSRSEAMKAYVREHCFSSDFSLQMAADHFGLTPSNLSHYFKNCTGMGLSEYVQEIRKSEACRLLSGTDEPIQEIGRRVGMENVSSFIRSFKQQTGLTPGQYRARYARSNETRPGT